MVPMRDIKVVGALQQGCAAFSTRMTWKTCPLCCFRKLPRPNIHPTDERLVTDLSPLLANQKVSTTIKVQR